MSDSFVRRARGWALALAGAIAGLLGSAPEARANCNLIPAAPREFRSVQGTVDRTLVAPGLRVAVRVDLACNPGATGFDPVAANNRVFVRFVPPGSDSNPSLATEIEIPAAQITPANCAIGGRCDTLLFFFPDAATLDAALAPTDDGLGLTGPVRVRVENLASNVLAEVGPLFDPTLACEDQQPESVFGHLTALPTPNPFGEINGQTALATLDGNGNLLVPIDYGAVLPSGPGSAVFRILEASANLDAFSSAPGNPIRVPDSGWLRSFNLIGRPIPPVLETNGIGDTVIGSVDAQLSVLRVARRDPDAPGAPLYDLSDRLFAGRGPIQIPNVVANARESAPLATLSADAAGITFARSEALESTVLNADGDQLDRVPQIVSVASTVGTSTGQALTEVSTPVTRRPPLVAGDGYVAFGASEGRQGYASANADGDAIDSMARVFDVATGANVPTDTTLDPDPVIDGRSLAISNGLVFFRTREGDDAVRSTTNATPTVIEPFQQRGDSQNPSLSRDGRFLAFDSFGGTTFFPGAPPPGAQRIYVLDRETGTYELISRTTENVPLDRDSFSPAISADGRWVAFASSATNGPGGPTATPDEFRVYLYDRGTQTLACVSCGAGPTGVVRPGLSADGRYVAFVTQADSLLRVWDRLANTTANLSQANPIGATVFMSGDLSMSDDGAWIAGDSINISGIPGGAPGTPVVFSRESGDFYVIGDPVGGDPVLSGDGEWVIWHTSFGIATDDLNVARDVYVSRRSTLQANFVSSPIQASSTLFFVSAERVSIDTEGNEGFGITSPRPGALSTDGRFAAFIDDQGTLVPGNPGGRQVYRYDRTTNVVEPISVNDAGDFANGFSNAVAISGDGSTVAFSSFATNLGQNTFDVQNVFVRNASGASLNGDADAADVVLRVFDPATQAYRATPVAASRVAVAAGRAALLSPETDEGDGNGDGDASDAIAKIVDGNAGTTTDLALAASAVAISDRVACFAVNEAAQGASDLNGDGDADDDVLHVRTLPSGPTANTGDALVASSLAATGTRCVFTASELAASPPADGNGDGDFSDAVLRVHDVATGSTTPYPFAVSDLVAREDVVAFRVCELDQGETDLNFDGDLGGDTEECIMHVLPLATGIVENTQRAALPCELDGCDPFFEPYRVTDTIVSFLTAEASQSGLGVPAGTPLAVDCKPTDVPGGCDLSGDGDALDAMISVYNLRTRVAQLVPVNEASDVPPFPTEIGDSGVLYVQIIESDLGEDANGDGVVTNAPVLVLVGDTDDDGTFDDATNEVVDSCVEVANADQADADRDGLGDGACDPAPTPVLPGDVVCDLDRNAQIDRRDLDVIFADRGQRARTSDARDADGDGEITVLDVSACRAQCTYAQCRISPPTGACGFGAELAIVFAGLEAARRRIRRRAPRAEGEA